MNIILLTYSKTSSGGARQALYMAQSLKSKGHNVIFFTPPSCSLKEKDPSLNWKNLPESFWEAQKAISSAFPPGQPVIVHAFHNRAMKNLACWGTIWRLKKLPIACAAHRGVVYKPGNPLPYLLPGIQRFTANSEACARILPLFWRKNKVTVIYNAIPKERITPSINAEKMRNELNLPQNAKIVTAVVNNNPVKGLSFLLEAFAHIQAQNTVLLAVGIDPKLWQKQCHELGIYEQVRLVPYINNVANYLNISDVFVLPSLFESQPNTLLEAMCMGLPAVCTAVGGVPEILPHKELLCPPRNSALLAEKLRLILENDCLRKDAAEANFKKSEIFTLEHRLKRIEAFYEEMLEELSQ